MGLCPASSRLSLCNQWDVQGYNPFHLFLQQSHHPVSLLFRALHNQFIMDLKDQFCLQLFRL